MWLAWNKAIKESTPSELPPGLSPEDQLLYVCGCYFIGQGRELQGENAASLDTMAKTAPDFRKMQFVKVRGHAFTDVLLQLTFERTTPMMKSVFGRLTLNG